MSPFQATYGQRPSCLLDYTLGSTSVEAVESELHHRFVLLASLKRNLGKAQLHMTQKANKKRKNITFTLGDCVLLRLQPYRQMSLHRRSSHKLSLRFYGPFEITERIGNVAYLLQLPSTSRIHPIFHVSLLRPFTPSDKITIHPLPLNPSQIPPIHTPAAIVSRRLIWRQGRQLPQVLVQWCGLPPEDFTWEDESLVNSAILSKTPTLRDKHEETEQQEEEKNTDAAHTAEGEQDPPNDLHADQTLITTFSPNPINSPCHPTNQQRPHADIIPSSTNYVQAQSINDPVTWQVSDTPNGAHLHQPRLQPNDSQPLNVADDVVSQGERDVGPQDNGLTCARPIRMIRTPKYLLDYFQ